MEKQILKTTPVNDRYAVLRDSSERTEKFTYSAALSEDELNELRTEFSKDAIELNKHEEVLKTARETFKLSAKPLKQNMAITIQKIRSRFEEVTEDVFLIADQEENVMGYYNSYGTLVYERPLMQNERQLRIVNDKSTGTY